VAVADKCDPHELDEVVAVVKQQRVVGVVVKRVGLKLRLAVGGAGVWSEVQDVLAITGRPGVGGMVGLSPNIAASPGGGGGGLRDSTQTPLDERRSTTGSWDAGRVSVSGDPLTDFLDAGGGGGGGPLTHYRDEARQRAATVEQLRGAEMAALGEAVAERNRADVVESKRKADAASAASAAKVGPRA
jgi:hypothetical protein